MAAASCGLITCLCAFTVLLTGHGFAKEEAGLFPDCCYGSNPDILDAGIGIIGEPKTVVVTRRSSLTLDCPVAAEKEFGSLSFSWQLNGVAIKSRTPKARVYMHRNGTLHVRKVMHRMKDGNLVSDEGLYECFVTNSVGTVLAQLVKVVVASVAKTFIREPQDQVVPVGGLGYFQCYIDATPSDMLVVWHKDGNIIRADSSPRHFVLGGVLQIHNVIPSDAGHYRCQVTNKAFFDFVTDEDYEPPQWRISREGVLTVTEETTSHSPIFLAKPQNITEVAHGHPAILECVIGGSSVRWKRNLRPSQDLWETIWPSANFTVLPGGSLQIHRVSTADQGIYTCFDVDGKVSASGELRILEEPVIQEGFQSRGYPLASMIRLDCVVSGQPKPKVRWLRNGTDVVEKSFRVEFLGDALVIYHSNVKDSGYYQCLAENKAGWALTTARIAVRVVNDAPPAPFNVTGEATLDTSITLSWDIEKPAGQLIGFTIHHQRSDGVGGEEVQVVVGNYRKTTLYELEPDTEYNIFVRAYNNFGASLNSPSVSVRTHINAHPSPMLSAAGSTSILVTWSDFHARYRKLFLIEKYRIYYGPTDSEHKQHQDVSGELDQYILKDLDENREYRIRMTAVFKEGVPRLSETNWHWQNFRTGKSPSNDIKTIENTGGSGTGLNNSVTNAVSAPVSSNFTTPLTMVIAAPVNLYAFPLKPDAITLQWDYPSKSHSGDSMLSPITHFGVRCQAIDSTMASLCSDTSKAVLYKTSHSNTVVLEDLQPFTLYNISVSAYNGDQQGPYSRPIYVQTKEDVPSKPENLHAKIVAEGEVQLFWQSPIFPNGQIQGHYIIYSNNNNNYFLDANNDGKYRKIQYSSWTHIYQQGNSTWAHVSNLTQQIYFFQVKACTAAGTGAPSTLLMVNMADSMPQRLLSDQHLGILGGSAIGLTSILITVVVISCRQRQLRRQLERQAALTQRASPSDHTQRPLALLGFQQMPTVARTEELENLLPLAAVTQATDTSALTAIITGSDCDSGDSGCSSGHPNTFDDLDNDSKRPHRPPDQEPTDGDVITVSSSEEFVHRAPETSHTQYTLSGLSETLC